MNEKKRISWIDIIRGLAFLMVIWYHLENREIGGVVSYFSPVFLTIFLFVSGYLTKTEQSFLEMLEQRTRTLYVPLLIFGIGGGIFSALLHHNSFVDAIIESFKGVVYQYGQYQTLWFIASLYVWSLLFGITSVH